MVARPLRWQKVNTETVTDCTGDIFIELITQLNQDDSIVSETGFVEWS